MPKPPKEGYMTRPSFDEIKRMNVEELKRVRDFTIDN
jgi:hypothetical protein